MRNNRKRRIRERAAHDALIAYMKRKLHEGAPFLIALDFHDGHGFRLFGAESDEPGAMALVGPLESKDICVAIIHEPTERVVYRTTCKRPTESLGPSRGRHR